MCKLASFIRDWSRREGLEVGKRTWLGAGQVGCRLGVGIRAAG
jgi:hypothetical protein